MRSLISALLAGGILIAATTTVYAAHDWTDEDEGISEDVKSGGNPAKPGRAI
jgi:hypothetical protein